MTEGGHGLFECAIAPYASREPNPIRGTALTHSSKLTPHQRQVSYKGGMGGSKN